MMMTCSFSGQVPKFPVVSKPSGLLFEKEVIEKHIRDYGKCPVTGDWLTMDDIIAITMGPRPEPYSNSDAQAVNGSSSTNTKKTSERIVKVKTAAEKSEGSITKVIEFHRKSLSQTRKNCRKISSSRANVNSTLRGYTFNKSYTLHETSTPGVLSLDIDHSKDIIATGGADSNAVVFELSSGKTSTLSGHSEKVTCVKFANKGELVVTGSGDNSVRVWKKSEKGSYEFKGIFDHHTAEVRAVTIHPSQKYFVTAALDRTWQLYDLSSESRVACGMGSESFSTAVFHPDGHIFGTCATGTCKRDLGLVRFWDVAIQDEILNIDAHKGSEVTSIAFSENGYTLATAARDGVKLWDLRFLRTMETLPSFDKNTRKRSVDFDHSGKYLATGGAHISIYQITPAPDHIATFSDISGRGDMSCVKFGKDAKYVASARTLDSKLLYFGPSGGYKSLNC
ncbi:Pre-mRNA-processing factor 19 [Heracleum sosnowskyi]|uniref:Pre-mRNA-processing factor 19 n=1 Tax=Heracleum sosnowskyi TaxID=360622 RepID=A0AAD8N1H4_9APIA|nr:Pre-mRNA-processing factor 19 [Heracleum sosnowskyi]